MYQKWVPNMPTNEKLVPFISKSKVGCRLRLPPTFDLSINVPALFICWHIWDPFLVHLFETFLVSFLTYLLASLLASKSLLLRQHHFVFNVNIVFAYHKSHFLHTNLLVITTSKISMRASKWWYFH